MFKYSSKEYWVQRYENDDQPFEWYQPYSALRPHIRPYLPDDARVLVVGNGTSLLGEDIAYELNTDVTCIDFAESATRAMTRRTGACEYRTADVTSMPEIPDGSFDAIIDKGCFDSVLTVPDARPRLTAALRECARVLSPGGFLISATVCSVPMRMQVLASISEFSANFAPVSSWAAAPAEDVAEAAARSNRASAVIKTVPRPQGISGSGDTFVIIMCKNGEAQTVEGK